MKKPMTVTCIITEEKGLSYCLMPASNVDTELGQQTTQEIPIAPRYEAKIIGGPLNGRVISIKKQDKSLDPVELAKGQKVEIQREPHHGFFYNDYLKEQDGILRGVNVDW